MAALSTIRVYIILALVLGRMLNGDDERNGIDCALGQGQKGLFIQTSSEKINISIWIIARIWRLAHHGGGRAYRLGL